MDNIPYVSIIFIAFAGLALASYIRHKKTSKETLVCPLRSNCNTVIFSDYSDFFGIPVELLGMAYYFLVAVFYGILLVLPGQVPSFVVFAAVCVTISAFLFSLYLTFIQGFALKQWCTWCLTSAAFSTAIFFLVVFGSGIHPIDLFTEYRDIILSLHLIAAAIGLGGATITDVFFFRFLKDFKISEEESANLNILSEVIWFALGVLIVTGIGISLPSGERLLESPKFILKMSVLGVIVLNGLFLNFLVSPKLVHISFGDPHRHHAGELHKLRKLAFALGAVSIISWYSVFILGAVRSLPFSLTIGYIVYGSLILLAIIGSQITERWFAKKAA